ncbi:acylphosphatase [Corallincola holothuriorum]|uniref:Acylphosphatase n=1 Tax=Corallincola holothuriorum TaxID=2282215 RepID=A0A368NRD0_9GAMM|nr:acylphosphatase [Corallincola holothuriorum]RCU52716.1 acylphosphatase [Corallincola holothuriorum]
MREARLCLVEGCVQGVGFRYYTQQEALKRGLSGYAKNLVDGRVELLIEGELSAISAMLVWLETGPRTATVESLKIDQVPCANVSEFRTL